MSQPGCDFLTLLARARAGDNEALASLVREYEPKVRVVARARLGPALRSFVDSTDLVQSVHRSLVLGLRGDKFVLSRPEDLLALALTLVRRKAAHHWHRARRACAGGLPADVELAEVLPARSDLGDDPAKAAEFDDQLRELSRHLSRDEHRMLAMRLDGYTYPEIAAVFGLHPIALRVRMTRLRQRLAVEGVLAECF